ncbi:MAG: M23 family metallopeptidase [Schleiferiaceae bacterium]|nr:M23 family metallopeptidase [Schleiferiaceae bacterium]MDR9442172.1 M23 family metallopeptidase [Schleiferiaceae bacterium]
MKMRLPFVFLLCFPAFLIAQDHPQDYFRYPLDLSPSLSGTFAEVRSNHFHSGIDLRTAGRIGAPVHAAGPGYVSRIKVSSSGFGRALYLRHPNGYTTVYAHLHRFNEELEAFLKKRQAALHQNEVDLYLGPEDFAYEKGAMVALSGNSGSSGGPHVHFEIRDSQTQEIINPLLFGFAVTDKRRPTLEELSVYEYRGSELVGNRHFRLQGEKGGQYYLTGDGIVTVQHTPAFGIETFDRLNGAPNHNGPYRIEMYLAGELCYRFTARRFAFSETRFANAHIDYSQAECCGERFQRLYRLPYNKFSAYEQTPVMHLPQLPPDSLVPVRVEVSDLAGNTAQLHFKVQQKAAPQPPQTPPKPDLPRLAPEAASGFKKENIAFHLPPKAVYQPAYLEHQVDTTGPEAWLSPIHQVGSPLIGLHRSFELGLRLKTAVREQNLPRAKMGLVRLNEEGELAEYLPGSYRDGFVYARNRQLGRYAVGLDTVPPQITGRQPGLGQVLKEGQMLTISVADDKSGIEAYNAWVDDTWVRLYYDAKADRLLLRAEDLPNVSGTTNLRLVLRDAEGNRQEKFLPVLRP